MELLKITGTEDLSEKEKDIISDIAKKHLEKLQKLFSEEISLNLLIKTYHPHEKNKEKKEYSIKAELFAKNKIASSNVIGWNLSTTLKETFEKIQHQVEHNLRK